MERNIPVSISISMIFGGLQGQVGWFIGLFELALVWVCRPTAGYANSLFYLLVGLPLVTDALFFLVSLRYARAGLDILRYGTVTKGQLSGADANSPWVQGYMPSGGYSNVPTSWIFEFTAEDGNSYKANVHTLNPDPAWTKYLLREREDALPMEATLLYDKADPRQSVVLSTRFQYLRLGQEGTIDDEFPLRVLPVLLIPTANVVFLLYTLVAFAKR